MADEIDDGSTEAYVNAVRRPIELFFFFFQRLSNNFRLRFFFVLEVACPTFIWKISICSAKKIHLHCLLRKELVCRPLLQLLECCSWLIQGAAWPSAGHVGMLKNRSRIFRPGRRPYSIRATNVKQDSIHFSDGFPYVWLSGHKTCLSFSGSVIQMLVQPRAGVHRMMMGRTQQLGLVDIWRWRKSEIFCTPQYRASTPVGNWGLLILSEWECYQHHWRSESWSPWRMLSIFLVLLMIMAEIRKFQRCKWVRGQFIEE